MPNNSFVQKGADCEFVLEIPDVPPAAVEASFSDLPQGVQFRASGKKDFSVPHSFASETYSASLHTQGEIRRGTVFTYTVRFTASGKFSLASARFRLNGTAYLVPFKTIDVIEDIRQRMPEFFFAVDERVGAGETVRMRLMGRCFVQVLSINWNLPENGMLEKTDEGPPLPFTAEKTETATEIARFVYTPFSEGRVKLPKIEVHAEAYDGRLYTLGVQDFELTVLPQTSASKRGQNDFTNLFGGISSNRVPGLPDAKKGKETADRALESVADKTPEAAVQEQIFALHLAKLRKRERTSFIFWGFRKERKTLEHSAGLRNPDEVSFTWTFFAAATFVFSFAVLFAVFRRSCRKRVSHFGNVAVFCILVQVCCAFVFVKNLPKLAGSALTAKSTMLRSIPEADANGTVNLAAGTYVKILRCAGIWYLVSTSGARSGWILRDECIIIQ